MYLNRLSGEQKNCFWTYVFMPRKRMEYLPKKKNNTYNNTVLRCNLKPSVILLKMIQKALSKITEVSTDIDLKIILFEISALVLSDNTFDKQEQNLVDKLTAAFQLGADFKEKALTQLKI